MRIDQTPQEIAKLRLTKEGQSRIDVSWKIWKDCEFCGRSICVNNYEDRKSRTPKLAGKVICPWCTPISAIDHKTVKNKIKYRTLMSWALVEKLADMNYCFKDPEFAEERQAQGCKCLGCSAVKLKKIQ